MRPQPCRVELAEERVVRLREKLEELLIFEVLDGDHLELEERVLTGVEVRGDDLLGSFEQHVENVASARRQHEHYVIGVDVEQLSVDAWVLPRDVVNNLAPNEREHGIILQLVKHSPDSARHCRTKRGGGAGNSVFVFVVQLAQFRATKTGGLAVTSGVAIETTCQSIMSHTMKNS